MQSFPHDIQLAIHHVKQGHVIAYPTEAVFGLGCDPFNKTAVTRLLILKDRPVEKGLILIASHWDQVKALTKPIPPNRFTEIQKTWPGPYTWIFPASDNAPRWITGEHPGIALRITSHPIAKSLCEAFQGPIVSTSANKSNDPPIKELKRLQQEFGDKVDYIVPGELGDLEAPTPIRDALTLQIIRL